LQTAPLHIIACMLTCTVPPIGKTIYQKIKIAISYYNYILLRVRIADHPGSINKCFDPRLWLFMDKVSCYT